MFMDNDSNTVCVGQIGTKHVQQTASDLIEQIKAGDTSLGLELGSTRIKAILVDVNTVPIAQGTWEWESKYEDGLWTYSLEQIHQGVRGCFADLSTDLIQRLGVRLERVGSICVSAMMHGYLAFDADSNLLVPFRTWRNTVTQESSDVLTALLGENIPQRWSISHLHRAMTMNEPHVKEISFITTLSGYVHWLLTGEKVLGIGDAVGMFPVDSDTATYREEAVRRFNSLDVTKSIGLRIEEVLPRVLTAGEVAGKLTHDGARFLDPTGVLMPGAIFAPPEGDAGTGMVATNAIRPRTGNVSVGTSVFAMIVLEESLERVHREIDIVATPDGSPVAMVHCNNGTGELDTWVSIFNEFAILTGTKLSQECLYNLLLSAALKGDPSAGGLMAINYLSGEHITGFERGTPMYSRVSNQSMSLANFIRLQLMTIFATLRIGIDILTREEGIVIDRFVAHGGVFKTPRAAQEVLASAVDVPVSIGESAGEGGAWGAAVLASFAKDSKYNKLTNFLENKVFKHASLMTINPDEDSVRGYDRFITRFRDFLSVERAAIEASASGLPKSL